jgi:DNA polymerase phi
MDSDLIKTSVWPNLSKQLNITKDKITLDTVYLLLLIEDHHPDTIEPNFYKKNWQSSNVLCKENLDVLATLLWKMDKINLINHPIYIYITKRLTNLKLLKPFWSEHVEQIIGKAENSKLIDIITVNFAVNVLKQLESPSKLVNLLTPNFLKMLQQQGSKLTKDEDIQEMYKEFYDSLDQRLQELKNDTQKLQVLKAFNELSVEKGAIKKFITNLINSLEQEGLLEAIEHVKSIIVSEQDDKERQYAATILQKIILTNKLVSNDLEWRIEQLNFFINLSLLKSSNGVDVSVDENPSSISCNIKNIFYHSLEHKFAKIEDEKKVLLGVTNHINAFMSKKNHEAFFQKPLDNKYCQIWKEMCSEAASKPDKKDKKLKTVFHILMMHMGLQLFNNPEVAENAISELVAVLDRVTKKKNPSEDEPAWIEVVIDLFLTLLSQESYVLRNVIRHVFPQLCSQINVAAFNQILSMLDIRNKENPLQALDGEDVSDDEEMSDLEEEDESMDVEENGIEEESDAESDDEGFSDIENDTAGESDEDVAIANTVKIAVQNALEENADAGSDIDVDDISPEEGKKLNATLGSAFKLLMEHRNLKKKKKSKTVMLADKALLHFRMRLLDLVEIYLKNNPQLEICLEILIFFFDLMPLVASHPELKPRFEKIFPQMSQLKTFSLETVQNVTQKNLADLFTRVLEKTTIEKTNIQQQNYFKHTCVFIIYSSQILQKLSPEEDDDVLRIMLEHVRQFITQRNPTLQVATFIKILSTQWLGNFKIAKLISDEGLRPEKRSLRRTQSLQMLKEFFKNHHLFNQNQKKATKYFGKILDHVKSYVTSLEEIPQQEFFELVYFLSTVRNSKYFTAREELISAIQKFRGHLVLKQNILNSYRTLCSNMKFEFISNDKIDSSNVKSNGTEQQATVTQNGTTKRKSVTITKKDKKMKKAKQLEDASEGLDADFSFA